MGDRAVTPPREVGPYRLEARLGAGGMGEVWRAYDARLDRQVAVKLIRPGSAEDGTARERLRREARAAAGLSHPAIVQIHDLVSSHDGEAIVMELVDGEPLAGRLTAGPLPVAEVLRLGREVAEGLAAAHARGVLHRDLKPENVMVTAEGHAKILDFGLAQRLEGEASLTRSGALVGTFRSMSPEQARGLPLDHRSDLFSLGTLLYEMATGSSPFAAASVPDTLQRICAVRQAPAGELRPEVPAPLSGAIDRLLEKDPVLRPASAAEVAATLATLAGDPAGATATALPAAPLDAPTAPEAPASWALEPLRWRRRRALMAAAAVVAALLLAGAGLAFLLRPRPAETLYVAVPAPRVVAAAGGESAGLTASGLRMALLSGLLAFEGVRPLAAEQVDEVPGSAVEVARALAADEVLTSSLRCDAEICDVTLARVRGDDGSLLWTRTFPAPAHRLLLLADAVAGHLRQGYSDREARGGAPGLVARERDYEEYLRLLRGFEATEQEEVSVASLLSRLAAIRAGSPRFLEPLLLEVEVLQYRYRSARDPADLERAFDLLRRAEELAPGDPRPRLALFDVALLGGELELAEGALTELERLQPGNAGVLARRARLLERRGDARQALALMETAARRVPSWQNLFLAGSMAYRMGRIPEARRYLEEVQERWPGHSASLSKLAEVELMGGSVERAAELYAELVRRSPRFEELTNLGLACLLLGRRAEAEAHYRQALALAPDNPLALLNLADATLLAGRRPEAEGLYERVLRAVAEDPATPSTPQLLTVRAQAQAHLGHHREAVAAVQEALRLAPENPQTAYEASLVYALLGDRASALFNAERALEQGLEPRWFGFPWFEPLRASPELGALLDRTAPPPAS